MTTRRMIQDVEYARRVQMPEVAQQYSFLRLISIVLYLIAGLVFVLGIIGGIWLAVTPSIDLEYVGGEYVVTSGAPMVTQGVSVALASLITGLLMAALAQYLSLQVNIEHHLRLNNELLFRVITRRREE